MTFTFINLLFWPALFLAVLPPLIHLFARSKPPKYQFSSIEFIRRIVRTTMRIKKPKDWLLLLIRTSLILLLILMFLRPLLFLQRKLSGHARNKNAVLVIDSTASMGCVDGAQTRFAAACAEAAEVLEGLSENDAANIVWLDSAPDSVFPEMGSNIGYLRNSLRQARVGNEAGDIATAVRMAAEMISDSAGRREICILSDFQKSVWESAQLTVPDGVDLILIKVGEAESANGSISDILFNPVSPLVGEATTIFCEVRNYSPEPKRRTVFLQAEESRQSQSLLIPAWGRATARFEYIFKKPGKFAVRAELNEDSYVGDDQRMELLQVDETLDVGLLSNRKAEAEIWKRVLNAIEWTRTRQISAADLVNSTADLDLLILSSWDGSMPSEITGLMERGTIVFCSPAAGLDAAKLAKLIPGKGVDDLEGSVFSTIRDPGNVQIIADQYRAFKLFAEGEYGDPFSARFNSHISLPDPLVEAGTPLAVHKDGTPALLRFKQNANLLIWNLPLDPKQSDWSNQVEFLPFVAEMIQACRMDSNVRQRPLLSPGERAVWQLDRDVPLSEIRLKGPEDRILPVASQPRETGVDFVSEPLESLGLYTWEYNTRPKEFDIVNFPTVESDLRGIAIDDLKKEGMVAVARGEDVRLLRDGIKLWPYLLGLALCLAIAEFGVLHWAEHS